MEEINLADRNGSDEKVYTQSGEGVGLDVPRMNKDIDSRAALKFFKKDSSEMNFTLLLSPS